MNVIEFGRLQSSAKSIGISHAEWAALRLAAHPETLRFYLELRRSLASEYADRRPFQLPARQLAEGVFLPNRRDRKLYMRLTAELVKIGLIERAQKPGFSVEGRRTPATFMFSWPQARPGGAVVFLADYHGSSTAGQ
jgi:hypothetical protein